jgi:hypothetical protein
MTIGKRVTPEWQAIVGLAAFIQMGIIAVARWFLADRDKQIAYRAIAERAASPRWRARPRSRTT